MANDHDNWQPGREGDNQVAYDRPSTVALGRKFTHIPEHVRQDLETLERECAVYADHWIDELGDFRHVRIGFTQEERSEFVRRSWAYDLFLRADVTWASEVPGIDEDVARDADTYSAVLVDGRKISPPYHCFAAFLGPHLEALLCSRSERETILASKARKQPSLKYVEHSSLSPPLFARSTIARKASIRGGSPVRTMYETSCT